MTELLTLARVQRADPTRHGRSAADVAGIARDVCRRFLPLAESRRIALVTDTPDGPLTALVDPSDLTDCVSNLVDNAIKYTPVSGTVRVAVFSADAGPVPRGPAGQAMALRRQAAAAPGGDVDVAIEVADSGLGMDALMLAEMATPEASGSVFDAFRRGNNALAAQIPGTGLGLAIVREVVEQSGGRIFVRSRQGAGTTMTVTFPTCERASGPATIRDTRSSIVVLEDGDDVPQPGRHTPNDVPVNLDMSVDLCGSEGAKRDDAAATPDPAMPSEQASGAS